MQSPKEEPSTHFLDVKMTVVDGRVPECPLCAKGETSNHHRSRRFGQDIYVRDSTVCVSTFVPHEEAAGLDHPPGIHDEFRRIAQLARSQADQLDVRERDRGTPRPEGMRDADHTEGGQDRREAATQTHESGAKQIHKKEPATKAVTDSRSCSKNADSDSRPKDADSRSRPKEAPSARLATGEAKVAGPARVATDEAKVAGSARAATDEAKVAGSARAEVGRVPLASRERCRQGPVCKLLRQPSHPEYARHLQKYSHPHEPRIPLAAVEGKMTSSRPIRPIRPTVHAPHDGREIERTRVATRAAREALRSEGSLALRSEGSLVGAFDHMAASLGGAMAHIIQEAFPPRPTSHPNPIRRFE